MNSINWIEQNINTGKTKSFLGEVENSDHKYLVFGASEAVFVKIDGVDNGGKFRSFKAAKSFCENYTHLPEIDDVEEVELTEEDWAEIEAIENAYLSDERELNELAIQQMKDEHELEGDATLQPGLHEVTITEVRETEKGMELTFQTEDGTKAVSVLPIVEVPAKLRIDYVATLSTGEEVEYKSTSESAAKYRAYRIAHDKGVNLSGYRVK